MDETAARKKRVRRLKKIILFMVGAAIIIPIITSILLLVRLLQVQGEVKELKVQLSVKEEADAITGVFATARVEESSRGNDYGAKEIEESQSEVNADSKKIYLTFDDGPSSNTDEILDVLRKYHVKATFFVVGKRDEQSKAMYRRITEEGHTLGMHSYSHKYNEIYASRESFMKDFVALQEYLYDVTGIWPRYYRFPGGSSNTVSKVDMQELIKYLNDSGITYYDWNIASGDAISGYISADNIINNCTAKIDSLNTCMILLHDSSDKNTTVEALAGLIEKLQAREDTVFYPITDDTVQVQHISSQELIIP